MRAGEIDTFQRKKAFEFIQENCSEALKATPIYRGSQSGKSYRLIDTTGTPPRRAANTANYANLYISQMPEWQAFPRRSLICTTELSYAKGYGTVFRVLPVDGTIIGVCPGRDFWGFPVLRKSTKEITGSESLPYYLSHFNMDLADASDQVGINLSDGTVDAFMADLDKFARIWSRKRSITKLFGKFVTEPSQLYKRLNYFFDPNTNGFTTTPIGSLRIGGNHEVWMDGKALMVNNDLFSEGI